MSRDPLRSPINGIFHKRILNFCKTSDMPSENTYHVERSYLEINKEVIQRIYSGCLFSSTTCNLSGIEVGLCSEGFTGWGADFHPHQGQIVGVPMKSKRKSPHNKRKPEPINGSDLPTKRHPPPLWPGWPHGKAFTPSKNPQGPRQTPHTAYLTRPP